MTIKQYKKLARANAKANGTSHQAELDAIARGHGHSNWGPFQASIRQQEARETCPVRSFVDSLGADEETLSLVEDALNGYLAENGTGISEYVESYEFRGEGGDILPDEDQRIYIRFAIARYLERHGSAQRMVQESRLRRAIEAFQKSHPVTMPLRLTKAPIIPEPLVPPAPYRSPLHDLPDHAPRIPLPLDTSLDDDEEGRHPFVKAVHPPKSPSMSLRPVSMPREFARSDIRPVEPLRSFTPTSIIKPVETGQKPLPKITRVETAQEWDRKMEEDFQRTRAKMDRLLEKMAELRSQPDDNTE